MLSVSLRISLESCGYVSNSLPNTKRTLQLRKKSFIFSFPYLFSFVTLAAGLQIRVDIDLN